MDDAEYAIVAFGSAARIAEKSVEIAREQGIKVGLFRPITLFPFPEKQIAAREADCCALEEGEGYPRG